MASNNPPPLPSATNALNTLVDAMDAQRPYTPLDDWTGGDLAARASQLLAQPGLPQARRTDLQQALPRLATITPDELASYATAEARRQNPALNARDSAAWTDADNPFAPNSSLHDLFAHLVALRRAQRDDQRMEHDGQGQGQQLQQQQGNGNGNAADGDQKRGAVVARAPTLDVQPRVEDTGVARAPRNRIPPLQTLREYTDSVLNRALSAMPDELRGMMSTVANRIRQPPTLAAVPSYIPANVTFVRADGRTAVDKPVIRVRQGSDGDKVLTAARDLDARPSAAADPFFGRFSYMCLPMADASWALYADTNFQVYLAAFVAEHMAGASPSEVAKALKHLDKLNREMLHGFLLAKDKNAAAHAFYVRPDGTLVEDDSLDAWQVHIKQGEVYLKMLTAMLKSYGPLVKGPFVYGYGAHRIGVPDVELRAFMLDGVYDALHEWLLNVRPAPTSAEGRFLVDSAQTFLQYVNTSQMTLAGAQRWARINFKLRWPFGTHVLGAGTRDARTVKGWLVPEADWNKVAGLLTARPAFPDIDDAQLKAALEHADNSVVAQRIFMLETPTDVRASHVFGRDDAGETFVANWRARIITPDMLKKLVEANFLFVTPDPAVVDAALLAFIRAQRESNFYTWGAQLYVRMPELLGKVVEDALAKSGGAANLLAVPFVLGDWRVQLALIIDRYAHVVAWQRFVGNAYHTELAGAGPYVERPLYVEPGGAEYATHQIVNGKPAGAPTYSVHLDDGGTNLEDYLGLKTGDDFKRLSAAPHFTDAIHVPQLVRAY